jgi:hypothetical protein
MTAMAAVLAPKSSQAWLRCRRRLPENGATTTISPSGKPARFALSVIVHGSQIEAATQWPPMHQLSKRQLGAIPAGAKTEDSASYERQVNGDRFGNYKIERRRPRRAAARRGRSAVAENLHCSGPVTGRKRHGPNPCDRRLCRFTPSFEQLFAQVRSTDQTIAGDAVEAETRKLLTSRGYRRATTRILYYCERVTEASGRRVAGRQPRLFDHDGNELR